MHLMQAHLFLMIFYQVGVFFLFTRKMATSELRELVLFSFFEKKTFGGLRDERMS